MDHFFKKKHLLLIDFTYAQRIPHVKARSNERTHVPISSSRLQRRLAATKAVSRFAASTEKEEKASKRSSASDTWKRLKLAENGFIRVANSKLSSRVSRDSLKKKSIS